MMEDVVSPLLTALGFVGDVLDTPGAILRNSLAGRNPFQGLFSPEERTSGRGLLEEWGVLGPNQEGFDAGDVGGFAAEMLLDPLNLVGAGLASKTAKAAKSAKKANALSDAMRAAGAMPESVAAATKVVDEGGKPLRTYHGTKHSFDKFSADRLDPEALYGRGIYTTTDPAVASSYAMQKSKGFQVTDADILEHFSPGNKVQRWGGGTDEVLSVDRHPDGSFKSVTVRDEQGRIRSHATRPDARDILKAKGGGAPNVRTQYVDIRNPFRPDNPLGETATDFQRLFQSLGSGAQATPEMSGREAYAVLKRLLGEVEENAPDTTPLLKSLGFDGVIHEGGQITGGVSHQVPIAFDPSQIYPPWVAPSHVPVPSASPLLKSLMAYNAAMTPQRF